MRCPSARVCNDAVDAGILQKTWSDRHTILVRAEEQLEAAGKSPPPLTLPLTLKIESEPIQADEVRIAVCPLLILNFARGTAERGKMASALNTRA